MADKTKPSDNPELELDDAALDDKSINELLKEYASDVKDKDLDEFLQDAPEDEDDEDAFENDDALMDSAVSAPQKSGGFAGILLVLLLCGAAGAGAWWYLNQDDGMTAIMGGFEGEPLPASDFAMPATPIMPEAAPSMPDFGTPTPMPSRFEQPSFEETPNDLASNNAQGAASESDVTAIQTPETVEIVETIITPPAAEPATSQTQISTDSDTAGAVDAWLSTTPEEDLPEMVEKLPPVVEQPVKEVKAKPVTIKADDKSAKPAQTAAAPKATNADDGALPPPYLAIQARKSGVVTPAAPAATLSAATQTQPASAAPMAPITEDDGQVYVRGSTAHTEPAQTRATGIYREMVARGGGEIELTTDSTLAPAMVTTTTVVEVPVINAVPPANVQTYETQAPAPVRSSTLAINAGRSLPPESSQSNAPSRTVVAPSTPSTSAPTATPAHSAPTQQAAPQANAASSNASQAASLLRDAQRAETEGKLEQAISLYQKALEADAIYGDGRSIDRGMVYDRIGAIRARQ